MRIARRIAAGLAIVLLVLGAALWAMLRASLPAIEGEATLKALGAPVEVLRDSEGIPHVFASSERDTWTALGFLHAQDRLWQMEVQRRVAAGRLSEVLGERTFDIDKVTRTLGIARMAEAIVAALDAPTRDALDAYAQGVNAFLDSDPMLPVEFQVLRVKPAPWKPADTVGWLLMMSWDLSGNWRSEAARMRLLPQLGPERLAQLMPAYPGDTATPLPDFTALYAGLEGTAGALLALSPGTEDAVGSNNWAVAGSQSAGGKPLLANDPHLGLQVPALWYLAHLASPAGNVVGGTLPGVPFVVLGRNDHLAWSMTTTNGDVQDLFIERVDPRDANRYLTPTGSAAFETREEVIRVGSEERRITVRTTRHGPVFSDAIASLGKIAPAGHVIALAWSALDPGNATARAGLGMNRARNRDEFLAAVRDFQSPQQNIVYATDEGHIGFVAPARIPVRRADNLAQGRIPVPGWDAKYDWQGWLAFEELPAVADPASGHIVTANHKITPPGYRPFIAVDWFPPYRADRIESLLAAQSSHTLASFARIQGDARSALALAMRPHFEAATAATEAGRQAKALLHGWDGVMLRDSPAPLVFAAWYRELTRLVYADELGPLFNDFWELRAQFMTDVMADRNGSGRWCDDVRTPQVEDCRALASRALDLAAADLEARYGKAADWSWGAAHVSASDHRPFGSVPGLARLFNVAIPTAGDSYSVNVGAFTVRDEQRPFANRHAGSLRALYDLADLDRSLYMQSTGQSGNRMSPWYANLAPRWAAVEYVTIPAKREAIVGAHRLVLSPRR